MTTTSIDAAQTLPVRLPTRPQSAPAASQPKRLREAAAFPVLLAGLGLVGLGYLGAAWLTISWLLNLVS